MQEEKPHKKIVETPGKQSNHPRGWLINCAQKISLKSCLKYLGVHEPTVERAGRVVDSSEVHGKVCQDKEDRGNKTSKHIKKTEYEKKRQKIFKALKYTVKGIKEYLSEDTETN